MLKVEIEWRGFIYMYYTGAPLDYGSVDGMLCFVMNNTQQNCILPMIANHDRS